MRVCVDCCMHTGGAAPCSFARASCMYGLGMDTAHVGSAKNRLTSFSMSICMQAKFGLESFPRVLWSSLTTLPAASWCSHRLRPDFSASPSDHVHDSRDRI